MASTHPYYKVYTDFQKPYNYWSPGHVANSTTTNYQQTSGEYPINNNLRYAAGWYTNADRYNSFFSKQSIAYISQTITQFLNGVHPEGKNIIVPEATILSVADSVYQYTGQPADVMQRMVIQYIVDTIKTEYVTINKNNDLNIWVTRYDQSSGLKQFNDVKLNKKGLGAYFQMRY